MLGGEPPATACLDRATTGDGIVPRAVLEVVRGRGVGQRALLEGLESLGTHGKHPRRAGREPNEAPAGAPAEQSQHPAGRGRPSARSGSDPVCS